jgi:hypothetical protein
MFDHVATAPGIALVMRACGSAGPLPTGASLALYVHWADGSTVLARPSIDSTRASELSNA